MSREIDERIVEMTFDNQQFERGVKTTLGTLDKLKKSLKFEGAADGLEEIQNAVDHIDFSKLISNSTFAIEKFLQIHRHLDQIIQKVEHGIKSLTIDQVTAGWSKYEEKTSSVQTIMAATAKDFSDTKEQMKYVNEQLEKLNWYTDETSYNFLDMTNNIGKFTSNGIKLDKSVEAMEGIANWAAISGANANEASRAMYNLAQALATGSVKLIDWKSIENANMATLEFKEQVIDTALALGTLKKAEDGTIFSKTNEKTGELNVVSATNFNENLKDAWFTSDVLMSVLGNYGRAVNKINEYTEEADILTSKFFEYLDDYKAGRLDVNKVANETAVSAERLTEMLKELSGAEYELSIRSFKAGQEAKTFTEAINSVKDAVSTGWMNTFETIFGNYDEAKELWTSVANGMYDVFAEGGNRRNKVLKKWASMLDENNQNGPKIFLKGIGNVLTSFTDTLGVAQKGFRKGFLGILDDNNYYDVMAKRLFNFTKAFEKFTSNFKFSEETLDKFERTFSNIFNTIRNVASPFLNIAGKIFEVVGGAIKFVAPYVTDITDKLSYLFKVLSGAFSRFANSAIGKAAMWVGGIISDVATVISETIDMLKEIELPDWLQNIINWGATMWDFLVGYSEESSKEVSDFLNDPFEQNKIRERMAKTTKTYGELVREIIQGLYGNDPERRQNLIALGLSEEEAAKAQDFVNNVFDVFGHFKDGYEEAMAEYDKMVLHLSGKDGTGSRSKAILGFGQNMLEDIMDGYYGTSGPNDKELLNAKDAEKAPRTFLEILRGFRDKMIAGLPDFLNKLGAAIATVKIKIDEFSAFLNEKLGIALEFIIEKWTEYSPKLKEAWENVKGFLTEIPKFIQLFQIGLRAPLSGIGADEFNNYVDSLDGLPKFFVKFGETVKVVGKTIKDIFTTIFKILRNSWPGIKSGALKAWDFLQNVFSKLKSFWGMASPYVSTAFEGLKVGLGELFGNLETLDIQTIISKLPEAFSLIGEFFTTAGSNIWSNIQGLPEKFESIKTFFTNLITDIGNFFTWLYEQVASFFGIEVSKDTYVPGATEVDMLIDQLETAKDELLGDETLIAAANEVTGGLSDVINWFTGGSGASEASTSAIDLGSALSSLFTDLAPFVDQSGDISSSFEALSGAFDSLATTGDLSSVYKAFGGEDEGISALLTNLTLLDNSTGGHVSGFFTSIVDSYTTAANAYADQIVPAVESLEESYTEIKSLGVLNDSQNIEGEVTEFTYNLSESLDENATLGEVALNKLEEVGKIWSQAKEESGSSQMTVEDLIEYLKKTYGSEENEREVGTIEKGAKDVTSVINGLSSIAMTMLGVKMMWSGTKVLGRMGKFLKESGSLMKEFREQKFGSKPQKIKESIIKITIAFAVMAAAIVALGYVKASAFEAGIKRATVIAIGIIALYAIVTAIGKIKSDPGKALLKIGLSILAIAVACLFIYSAVKKYANMDPTVLVKGLGAIAVIMLMIAGFSWLVSKGGKGDWKNLAFTAVTIIATAVAIRMLAGAVKKLGKMDPAVLAKGLIAVFALLLEIGLFTGLMGKDAKGFAVLIAVAISIQFLVAAVYLLGRIDSERLEKGILALGAILLFVGVAVRLVSGAGLRGAGAFLLIAVAIIAIVGALELLSNVGVSFLAIRSIAAIMVGIGTMVKAISQAFAAMQGVSWAAGIKLAWEMGSFLIVFIAMLALIAGINSLSGSLFGAIGGYAEEQGWGWLAQIKDFDLISAAGKALDDMANALLPVLETICTFISENLMPLITEISEGLGEAIGLFAGGVIGAFNYATGQWDNALKVNDAATTANIWEVLNTMTIIDEDKRKQIEAQVGALAELENQLPDGGGLKQFFEGGKNWYTIANGLDKFGKGLLSFSTSSIGVVPAFVKKGAEAGKELATVLEKVPDSKGVIQYWFGGGKEWDTLSNGLAPFGAALVAFSTACIGVSTPMVTKGASAATALAKAMEDIPDSETAVKIGNWFVAESGGKSWDTLSDGLVPFAEAMVAFGNASKDVVLSDVENGAAAISTLATEMEKVPGDPGKIEAWFGSPLLGGVGLDIDMGGRKSWDTISEGLSEFAWAMVKFGAIAVLINYNSFDNAVNAAGKLVDVVNAIPPDSGVIGFFTGGDIDISKFAANLGQLGSGFYTYYNNVKDIDDTKLDPTTTLLTGLKDLISAVGNNFDDQYDTGVSNFITILGNLKDLTDDLKGVDYEKLNLFATSIAQIGDIVTKTAVNDDTDPYDNWLSVAVSDFIIGGITAISDTMMSPEAKLLYDQASVNFAVELQKSLNGQKSTLYNAGKGLALKIANGIKDARTTIYNAGVDVMAGLREGINAGSATVFSTVESIGLKVATRFRNVMQVRSPSRVTEEIGEYISLGLAQGMTNEQSTIENSAGGLVNTMRNILARSSAMLSDDVSPIISPVVDMSNVSRSAGLINGMFGSNMIGALSYQSANAVRMNTFANGGYSDTNAASSSQQVVTAMGNIRNDLNNLATAVQNMQIVLDGKTLVGSITPRIDNVLAQRVGYAARRN